MLVLPSCGNRVFRTNEASLNHRIRPAQTAAPTRAITLEMLSIPSCASWAAHWLLEPSHRLTAPSRIRPRGVAANEQTRQRDSARPLQVAAYHIVCRLRARRGIQLIAVSQYWQAHVTARQRTCPRTWPHASFLVSRAVSGAEVCAPEHEHCRADTTDVSRQSVRTTARHLCCKLERDAYAASFSGYGLAPACADTSYRDVAPCQ
jgi:hypothetical protein